MNTVAGSDAGKLALYTEQKNMLDMISLRFSEQKTYEVGDYVLYFNGTYDGLYRFKGRKSAGAWNDSVVEAKSLTDVLKAHEASIASHEASITALNNERTVDGGINYPNLNDLPGNTIAWYGYRESYQNAPPRWYGGVVTTTQAIGGVKIQYAHYYNEDKHYIRRFYQAWSNWEQIILRDVNVSAGGWSLGTQNAGIKCTGASGDNFVPFVSINTDGGYWIIGTHPSSNRLVFRYQDASGANSHNVFLEPPSQDKILQ